MLMTPLIRMMYLVMRQNKKEHALENEIQELLVDRVDEFRKEIFNSSEAEMQQALLRLKEFNTWQEASAYIQKDIFKKNDVNLLSGATVDFTDRMHRFLTNAHIHKERTWKQTKKYNG